MWEEMVNRLVRHGEDYKLSEALKKVALKNILVGKMKGQLRGVGVRRNAARGNPSESEGSIPGQEAGNICPEGTIGHQPWREPGQWAQTCTGV